MASAPNQHPLVRKLESITDLTPEERQALLDLPMKVQPIGADQGMGSSALGSRRSSDETGEQRSATCGPPRYSGKKATVRRMCP
jgi:hypothetical protein